MPDGSHYDLWPIQMSTGRLAKAAGIHFVNITVKSGVQAFGPDWEPLMRHKRGQCSDEEYTELYLKKMEESMVEFPKTWLHLLFYNKMAFGCYCGAGKFCHRHLFIKLVKDFIETHGGTVTVHEELTKENLPA